jgi:hypothetical protein
MHVADISAVMDMSARHIDGGQWLRPVRGVALVGAPDDERCPELDGERCPELDDDGRPNR